ncbi:DUF2339 domain-containing protein [Mesorhizobium atlanticum]
MSRTPVFNWLLPGYGVPALAFGFAAWQLARTTSGRPRLAMEAASALFALLTIAMLVRHAMHGGVIDIGAVTLAEQAIYTLIALGAGAILVAIDMRSPSSVLRYGSIAAGVISAGLIAIQHFVVLNPLLTDESTGTIPVFNLLFLAYLLPAIAAGALALYVRDKRPRWYAAMLALIACVACLRLRHALGAPPVQGRVHRPVERTWAARDLHLFGAVAGHRRGAAHRRRLAEIAGAAHRLRRADRGRGGEGLPFRHVGTGRRAARALFIGLGAVLIGIGLFYQRLLTRAARDAK